MDLAALTLECHGKDTNLGGSEARWLGSLSQDVVIDQRIGKREENLSLWG